MNKGGDLSRILEHDGRDYFAIAPFSPFLTSGEYISYRWQSSSKSFYAITSRGAVMVKRETGDVHCFRDIDPDSIHRPVANGGAIEFTHHTPDGAVEPTILHHFEEHYMKLLVNMLTHDGKK